MGKNTKKKILEENSKGKSADVIEKTQPTFCTTTKKKVREKK